MPEPWDVLGLGVVAVDDLLYVDRYPAPDSKTPVRERRREGGGLTGTALVAAARLGARAAYAGILGEDELSLTAIGGLERAGVDCSLVPRRPGARPTHSTIIVDRSTGRRTILYSREGVTPRSPEEVTAELVGATRVLFLDHTTGWGGLRALEMAQARGVPVVLDAESETEPGARELVQRAGHLILGIQLAARLTGEAEPAAIVRALAAGRACCAVTAGEEGCWFAERGGPVRHQGAFPVQVVDTTGCGDVFHGAYAACLARGEPVGSAIRIAAAAAALKATRPGGRAGVPTWDEVASFLATQAG